MRVAGWRDACAHVAGRHPCVVRDEVRGNFPVVQAPQELVAAQVATHGRHRARIETELVQTKSNIEWRTAGEQSGRKKVPENLAEAENGRRRGLHAACLIVLDREPCALGAVVLAYVGAGAGGQCHRVRPQISPDRQVGGQRRMHDLRGE
ncbi:hypothetical protein BH18ACI1_BH18ACI1_24130 [soil metagenome]